jgi:hypothetical protein
MFTLFDRDNRLKRRDFLRVGSLGLGGLSLSSLLGGRAFGADKLRPVTDKSVIFLFMHGGPSQIETFDPKMTAPAEMRSTTGEVATAIPGETFGGTYVKLAKLANKLAVVRNFVTGNGNHDIKPVVCPESLGANLGSIYARVAGINHPVTGMPANAALFPQAVDSTTRPTTMNFGKFEVTGGFGAAYAPFVPGGGGNLQRDMKLNVPMERLDDRRSLLAGLDKARWALEQSGAMEGMDKLRQQAFTTILGGIADAFDLNKEGAKLIARYDTAPLVKPDQIDKKWNNYNNYVDNAKSLGKLLLLARRLCENGCGFVTITTNFVWDMHADKNNAGCEEGMRYMGVPFDHAVSAFIEDVEARGLSEKIMLVACGEMGRTPRINKAGGRDHWGNLAPLLLYGGGLKTGQVVGRSDRIAGEPNGDSYGIKNLIATILHNLIDHGTLRTMAGVPTELLRIMDEYEPIREVTA